MYTRYLNGNDHILYIGFFLCGCMQLKRRYNELSFPFSVSGIIIEKNHHHHHHCRNVEKTLRNSAGTMKSWISSKLASKTVSAKNILIDNRMIIINSFLTIAVYIQYIHTSILYRYKTVMDLTTRDCHSYNSRFIDVITPLHQGGDFFI